LTRRLVIAGAAAAIVAVAALLGGALRGGSQATSAEAAPSVASERLAGGFAGGDTPTLILSLQNTLRLTPSDGKSWALLGLAYQQRARETADPSYYSKSEGALRRSLAIDPRDLTATSGLGSLELSRHRFEAALALGRKGIALSPTTARDYGVVGDALIELGRYRQAIRAFDMFAHLKPGLSSYSRISYARELRGDQAGAVSAMKLGVAAAVDAPEASAWTRVQLGKIYWAHGQADAAAAEYRQALVYFPGYVYAFDALAPVEWARGHRARAIALEQRAVDIIPLPQFVGQLGDMLRAAGHPAAARRQYATEDGIRRLLAANGVVTDLETALFDVDHGFRLGSSLALARKAQHERPSIDGDDVLAWALARNGRCHEALAYSRLALRLGTQDAIKYFHRGMIERCLGDSAEARAWFRRALDLNPAFSVLWAPLAKRLA
jgi:tetratricopeptide (TPR) repeat protein